MGAGVSLSLSREGIHGASVFSLVFSLISDPFPRDHGVYVGFVPSSREQIYNLALDQQTACRDASVRPWMGSVTLLLGSRGPDPAADVGKGINGGSHKGEKGSVLLWRWYIWNLMGQSQSSSLADAAMALPGIPLDLRGPMSYPTQVMVSTPGLFLCDSISRHQSTARSSRLVSVPEREDCVVSLCVIGSKGRVLVFIGAGGSAQVNGGEVPVVGKHGLFAIGSETHVLDPVEGVGNGVVGGRVMESLIEDKATVSEASSLEGVALGMSMTAHGFDSIVCPFRLGFQRPVLNSGSDEAQGIIEKICGAYIQAIRWFVELDLPPFRADLITTEFFRLCEVGSRSDRVRRPAGKAWTGKRSVCARGRTDQKCQASSLVFRRERSGVIDWRPYMSTVVGLSTAVSAFRVGFWFIPPDLFHP